MEKESLAQSATRDRAATSIIIYGITIDTEERRDVFGAHYLCIRSAVAFALGGCRGERASSALSPLVGVLAV
jgi:hypothetical protein